MTVSLTLPSDCRTVVTIAITRNRSKFEISTHTYTYTKHILAVAFDREPFGEGPRALGVRGLPLSYFRSMMVPNNIGSQCVARRFRPRVGTHNDSLRLRGGVKLLSRWCRAVCFGWPFGRQTALHRSGETASRRRNRFAGFWIS